MTNKPMGIARALLLSLFFTVPSQSAAAAEEPFRRGHQLGFSIGLPAGLNAEYAFDFGKRAVYLSGAYWGMDLYGVQAGMTLERSGTQRKAFSVNLVGGYFAVRESEGSKLDTWAYGGIEVHLRYRRIFLAPAVTFGGGSLSEGAGHGPVLLPRLGFTWPL